MTKKTCVIFLYTLAILLVALPAAAQAPAWPEFRSPEVHADGRVTFRHHAPNTAAVVLVREDVQPVPMTADSAGVWSHTTNPLPPDLYSYYFTIDGSPTHDPHNPVGLPLVLGGRRSLVHVPGPDSLPWEASGAPAGELRRHEYASTRFGETRELWVYTPPGYDATAGRDYPVLYLLHGVLEDAGAWSTAGRVDVILDNLLARQSIEPMIVVMPLGYGFPDAGSRAMEMFSPATDQRAVMDAFAEGLLGEVVPLVEHEYRVGTGPASRAIAGLSMGGAQALYIGLNHPEMFGWVASFGGAIIMYGGRYDDWFPAMGTADGRRTGFVSVSVGQGDFLLGPNRHFVEWLASRGMSVDLREVPGAHTWSVWRRELIRVAPLLFRDEAEP